MLLEIQKTSFEFGIKVDCYLVVLLSSLHCFKTTYLSFTFMFLIILGKF